MNANDGRKDPGDPPGSPSIHERLSPTGKFQPAARVLRRREFTRIHDEGVRVHTACFSLVFARTTGLRAPDVARLGLTVSRKVGNAVVRNRLRRVLRELFRRTASSLPPLEVIVIAKPAAAVLAKRGLAAVAEEVLPALQAGVARLERRGRPGEERR